MKRTIPFVLALLCCLCLSAKMPAEDGGNTLKSLLGDKFLIGVALNEKLIYGRDTIGSFLVRKHFNSIVAENCMKHSVIHPSESEYNFGPADRFVEFGMENDMFIIGHCLIWHSQLADWFCKDKDGNDVTAAVLKERIRDHISTVVGRYKGKVKGWDVVNEAIMEDGTFRKSKFYEIMGEEFIYWAFECAHNADPDAELYYNDYNMHFEGKRNAVVRLVGNLKKRGIRIDAVGMQGHVGMYYPDISEFEKSILAYSKSGAGVMITEWDMSALPSAFHTSDISHREEYSSRMNPYKESLPDSVSSVWNKRMGDYLSLFMKHSNAIRRVTVWGLQDGDSWLNNFPVRGRHDYPLLFDRQYNPKPFVKALLEGNFRTDSE